MAELKTLLTDVTTVVQNLSRNLTAGMAAVEDRLDSLERNSRSGSRPVGVSGEHSLGLTPQQRFPSLDEAIIELALQGRLPSDQLYKLVDPGSAFLTSSHRDLLSRGDEIAVNFGGVDITLPQSSKAGLKGTLHATTMKKVISSPVVFTAAWLVYMELWAWNTGEDAPVMFAALGWYCRLIIEWSATRDWQSILAYHIAFAAGRLKGQFRVSDWYNALDNVLYTQHVRMRTTPAGPTAPAKVRAPTQAGPSAAATGTASYVCNRFQTGHCKGPCGRRHVCMSCHGNHQQRYCDKLQVDRVENNV
jgi:hypothetical protein